jgi:hypothetical protein
VSDSEWKGKATIPISAAVGNALFEKAVGAMGLDDAAARWMFVSVLNAIGAAPATMTPDELGNVLPEIDRRVRQLVQGAQADQAMARLFKVLFDQAGPA